jgi:NitT/TauT family transport system substrate-binding protein
MKRFLIAMLIVTACAGPGSAETQPRTMRVAMCFPNLTLAAAPFAVAIKMGWFSTAGLGVDLVPLSGSLGCAKGVATGAVDVSLASIDALAMIRLDGVKAKNFYTAYQGNIYGLMVPADSTVETIGDLKNKRIGVASMASTGVIVARALASSHGLDADHAISFVVSDEVNHTAELLRSKQIDALSMFDTHYASLENIGLKLRPLDNSEIAQFPSNGLIALEQTVQSRRADAVTLAEGYAKGTIFTIANPEAAIRILFEVFPQTRPADKDEASAIREGVRVLQARAHNWQLESGGVKRWGESSKANYVAYVDFLEKWGVLRNKVDVDDLVTLDLIDDINKFDPAAITTLAKHYLMN